MIFHFVGCISECTIFGAFGNAPYEEVIAVALRSAMGKKRLRQQRCCTLLRKKEILRSGDATKTLPQSLLFFHPQNKKRLKSLLRKKKLLFVVATFSRSLYCEGEETTKYNP
jgi:hypothetical protein